MSRPPPERGRLRGPRGDNGLRKPERDEPWSSQEDGATIHRLPLLSGDVGAQALPEAEYKALLREGAQKLPNIVFELDARHRFELFHAFYLKMAYPLWLAARRPPSGSS
ncbi:MAG: hypothetical protein R3A10_01990 [Caldilineaceae bacterium]